MEDHITLYVDGNDKLAAILKANAAGVQSDVLADAVVYGSADGYAKEWDINGENVRLGVKR